mgnify:CR=1 FL=1
MSRILKRIAAGVAIAGVVTGYLASMLGAREGLLWFGMVVIVIYVIAAVFAPCAANRVSARAIS